MAPPPCRIGGIVARGSHHHRRPRALEAAPEGERRPARVVLGGHDDHPAPAAGLHHRAEQVGFLGRIVHEALHREQGLGGKPGLEERVSLELGQPRKSDAPFPQQDFAVLHDARAQHDEGGVALLVEIDCLERAFGARPTQHENGV